MASLARRLGWTSIRGRYLYGATLFAMLLFGAAIYTETQVVTLEDPNTLERNAAQPVVHALAEQLRRSEIGLQEYRHVGGATRAEDARNRIALALDKARGLADNDWVKRNNANTAIAVLTEQLQAIDHEIGRWLKRQARPDSDGLRRIDLLFEQIWITLSAIDSQLSASTIETEMSLTNVANRLSHAVWLLVGFGGLTIVFGFLLFEFSVRAPMARLATALKAEADGKSAIPLPDISTDETKDVLAAFERMRRRVLSRQQRLKIVLDNAAEGIITFDQDGIIEQFNQAAERLFGYSESEIAGCTIDALLVPPEGYRRKDYGTHFIRTKLQRLLGQQSEVTGRHKDGSTFTMSLKVNRIELDGRALHIALAEDVSEEKAMMERLKDMAEHDGLTSLYNRTYFQQELDRVVERTRRTQTMTSAVMYIDLDNFKYVNDTLGHAAGDRLLIEVAGLLHRRARKSDLIARFGGDEFTVLLYDVNVETALRTAESFRKRLADYRFRHQGEEVIIGCSIGVAGVDLTTGSAEEALSHADLACHLAKRNGRNQVHMYTASDADSVAAMSIDMGWSRRIKDAIENDNFTLVHQPIVSVATGKIDAYEVMIRLRDEVGAMIMPAGFLMAAERFGLSTEIDMWVIRRAIDLLARQRAHDPALKYAINLSGSTLGNLAVCDLVQQKLAETGLDPSALTFEITETVAITDMQAARAFLSRLRAIGCRAALDDFGSGMSSFGYLRDLPVDYVKIDGRFVRNAATDSVDQAMLRAINDIVHALGKQTIAEWVETADVLAVLKGEGVDYAQGYFLGRPEVIPATTERPRLAGSTDITRSG